MNLKIKILPLLILTTFIFTEAFGQVNFTQENSIIVLKANGDTLKNPWAGGFNSVQFSEIDLNLDGIKDLFVFDRAGNRISTFINDGTPNQVTYKHDPAYIQYFPKNLHGWVLLRDYNCDGKMDIFTYTSGAFGVYENTSTTYLDFTLKDGIVYSNYLPNYINLYVSSNDIPAIDDIDGDGDLDVLTFSILGGQVEYHKNLSIEKYGSCDSLDFELSNKCWGFFTENFSSNSVMLYDTCSNNVPVPQKNEFKKHAGSTLFTLDVDSNNSKELVLGDISFNNFTMLTNGDTTANLNKSSIIAQDSLFPQNNASTVATDIDMFPAGFYIDVNNDNVKDLIAAPNCHSGCKNSENTWYYKNDGASNYPNFNLTTTAFLQEGMIEVGEGAHPVFFDYNADGLTDIIIGNYGVYDPSVGALLYSSSLWLYENVGTTNNPVYQLVDTDYLNISTMNLDVAGNRPTLGLRPAFGDIDGDNDLDLILGDYNGFLHYFRNSGGAGNPASFSLSVPNYLGIDVGNNATPTMYDIDGDNLLDLIIGKRNGTISYYNNQGTALSPSFTFVTDSLGKIVTKRYLDFNGNSSPFIIDSAGTTILYSGAKNGHLYKYGNIDGNLTGTFSVDSNYLNFRDGKNTSISLTDANNDGNIDMLVGNYAGGVAFYKGNNTVNVKENEIINELNIYPNPTNGLININFGENKLENANIRVIDLLGKTLINTKVFSQKTTLNLNNYAKGIYIIKFSNKIGSKVYKVVKE